MVRDTKGVPRHSFNQEGEWLAVDTCGVELGSRLLITTEDGGDRATTTFVRTAYERGAMHDWQLESADTQVALSHSHATEEGATFIDRSVILKLGNLVSYQEWDTSKKASNLGRIVALEVHYPFETDTLAAIVEMPYSSETALGVAA